MSYGSLNKPSSMHLQIFVMYIYTRNGPICDAQCEHQWLAKYSKSLILPAVTYLVILLQLTTLWSVEFIYCICIGINENLPVLFVTIHD